MQTTDAAEDGAAQDKKAEAAPLNETKAAFDKTETGAETEVSVPAVTYTATAYSLRGRTASGSGVRRGIIAADRRVLPLGTRVRLEAGSYSGEYLVADTGGAVRGRKIDIWVPHTSEAMRFGRRPVKLTVLTRTRPRTTAPRAGR
jgi:3D (Asp-Asp-Asp) domain-containing protein